MKACEKYLEKLGSHYMNTASGSPLIASKDGYRDGWRAALEWELSVHGPLQEGNNNCDCARMRTRKELEIEK